MRVAPIAVLLCSALAVPASAQMETREGITLQNQILELRRDIQALQQQRGGGPAYGAPPAGYGAPGGGGLETQLLDRVQTLEDQVRRLRGQLDEQSNTLRRAQDNLSKQLDDLNFRLGRPPSGAGTSAPGNTPAPARSSAQIDSTGGSAPSAPPSSPPSAAPRRTPETALQQGNAALARRDYPAAEAAAREVLGAGRSSPRAGDANFLLAQALLGQRDYQGAAVAYDDAYNRARTGSRAPDALLGVANALTGLSDKRSACVTLDKLRREFPSVRGPVRDTANALRARNGCS